LAVAALESTDRGEKEIVESGADSSIGARAAIRLLVAQITQDVTKEGGRVLEVVLEASPTD
jgi:hypothetical protein